MNSTSDHDGLTDGNPGDVVTYLCNGHNNNMATNSTSGMNNNNNNMNNSQDLMDGRRMLFSRCTNMGHWTQPGSCKEQEREEQESDSEPDQIPSAGDRDDNVEEEEDEEEMEEVISGCPKDLRTRLEPGETVVLQSEGFEVGQLSTMGKKCKWIFVSKKVIAQLINIVLIVCFLAERIKFQIQTLV